MKFKFFCIFATSVLTLPFAHHAEKQEVTSLYIDCNFYSFSSPTLQHELSPNSVVRTINKEVGEFLLAETMAILPLIVAIDQRELAQASLRCSNDCGYTLSCAEFGGSLVACGPDAILEIIEFKKLLNGKDPTKLRSFMLKISNEKSVHCPLCKQCAWIE
ncbi:MAG: hypothetical protein WCW33_03160 [Candidatus Babeliales bacterium]